MNSKNTLDQLATRAHRLRQNAAALLEVEEGLLYRRPDADSWNALECLEHLSLTYDYYLPQLEKALAKAERRGWKARPEYRPGFFGDRMAKGIQPGEGGKVGLKMKTFRRTTPHIGGRSAEAVLHRFLSLHRRFEAIITQSAKADLQRTRVTSLIGPMLRFRLGDALRFLQGHNERHWLQARRAIGKLQAVDENI